MFRFIQFLLLSALACNAAAVEYATVLPERSRITFTSRQMGVAVDGSFKKFNAAISFDPARPEAGKAQIDIDLGSVDAGSEEADEEVKGKGWFNVGEFPTAKFVSESLRALGNNGYEAKGKIAIKGKTRDMLIPFAYKADGANAVLEGSIPVLRSQFGLGDGPWADTSVVADEVPVKFRLVVAPKAATN